MCNRGEIVYNAHMCNKGDIVYNDDIVNSAHVHMYIKGLALCTMYVRVVINCSVHCTLYSDHVCNSG